MKFHSNHLGWSWSWRNRNFCKPVSNGTKRSKSCYYESFERWNWGNPNTCWLLGGKVFLSTPYLRFIKKLITNEFHKSEPKNHFVFILVHQWAPLRFHEIGRRSCFAQHHGSADTCSIHFPTSHPWYSYVSK